MLLKAVIFLLLLSCPAYAATKFMEAGTDATQDMAFYSGVQNACTSATDQVYTGSRSAKLSTGSPATQARLLRSGVLADSGRRISFRYRFDNTPAANDFPFMIRDSGDNAIANITHTTSNTLSLAGANTAAGSTVLSANKWYRISLSYTISSTSSFRFQLYIDGIPEANMTTGTLPRTGSNTFRFLLQAAHGTNHNLWFDDIYIDDGSDYSDPGDIRITAKRPISNGTTNGFTGTGTPSGYGTGNAGYVNEVPLSETNYVSVVTVATAITEEYNLENKNTGQVDISSYNIVDIAGWLWAKSLTGETAQLVLNGVNNAITLTTSPALYTAYQGKGSTSPARTGTDIGLVTDNVTATTVTLYEAGILEAFRPYPNSMLGDIL